MRTTLPIWVALTPLTTAARFLLHLPATSLLNPSSLPSTTHAILQSSGPPLTAYITRSNSFNFNNVSAGSYLATIHSRDYAFEPLRIDVSVEEAVEGTGEVKEVVRAWQTFLGNEWENKGESRGEGGNGLVVEVMPRGEKEYYQVREGFSPLSFLKNPMILMALFTLGLVFGMPYLMENMDPETRAEFEDMQRKGALGSGTTNTAQQIQNFDLASWMAGKTDTGASSGASSSAAANRGPSPAAGSKRRG